MTNNIVDQFIYSFSRAEFALKASCFLKNTEEAQADWDAFIRNIKDRFNENKTEELKQAIEYIKNNPPKKQVVENNQLDWKQTNNDGMHLAQFLNIMLRRIRNNLFHGGKLHTGFTEDISRDLRLIESANVIIKEMIMLNEEVNRHYNQPIK